jgi:hypothetical protein
MRSESEANLFLLNAKKCEANPFQKNAKKIRKSYKKCENFAKILNEAMRCIKVRFLPKLRSVGERGAHVHNCERRSQFCERRSQNAENL